VVAPLSKLSKTTTMYNHTMTDNNGETYSTVHEYRGRHYEFMGYSVFKNGNYITTVTPDKAANDAEAITAAKIKEREDDEAEKAFFKAHPELNP
jgi:hypothetical protein